MEIRVGGKYKLIATPKGIPEYEHNLETGQTVRVSIKEGSDALVCGRVTKAVAKVIKSSYIHQWVHVGCLAPITENKEVGHDN